MAPRSIRKALGAVKDQTSIGIAKVAGSSVPELEVAIVKATSHDEGPVEDKYVHELVYLTSYSRGYVNACLGLLARRLSKTRNWVVAVKTLIVTHRLLKEADATFEDELMRIARRMLSLSSFTDESRSNGWDYTAFVRTYGLYLDERLDCYVFAPVPGAKRDRGEYRGEYRYSDSYYDERRRDSPPRQQTQPQNILKAREMKPDMLLDKVPMMQRIMERVLACRPAGAASYHRLTQVALHMVVRESFQLYTEICDGIAVLLDAFFDMEYPDAAKAFDIYARSAKQGDELASFYEVCKKIGVARTGDYPSVPKIAKDHLDTLEDYLREKSRAGTRVEPERPKSPEPAPPPPEPEPEVEDDLNGMKALPAPPVEPVPEVPTNDKDADLLNLGSDTDFVAEGDRLALALFSTDTASANSNGKWEPFGSGGGNGQQPNGVSHLSENGKEGWELALVTEASNLSRASNGNNLAGGMDKLLLDSLYEQGTVTQKYGSAVPAGSASSVAIPGKPTNYLALPAPPGSMVDDDPFSASMTVPPPPYVQIADMHQKQQLLTQEQQLWDQYQRNGMQGQFGYTNYYGHPYYQQQYGMPGYGYGYQ